MKELGEGGPFHEEKEECDARIKGRRMTAYFRRSQLNAMRKEGKGEDLHAWQVIIRH